MTLQESKESHGFNRGSMSNQVYFIAIARWGRRPSAPWVPVVLPLPPLAATLHTKKRNQGKGLLFADTSTRS